MKKALILFLVTTGCVMHNYPNYDDPANGGTPPSAPQGVYSVTGDEVVYLYWLPNSEPDLSGYRVWRSNYAEGPYTAIGETNTTSFADVYVTNGETYFYAVTAYDVYGNESELSYELIFDTPRPEGTGTVWSYITNPDWAGWDFSEFSVVPYDDPGVDFFYEYDDSLNVGFIYVGYDDTYIQDMGYTEDFDEIGYAPVEGWSSLGVLEAIEGHIYIFWTWDNHFAKIRILNIRSTGSMAFEWAYQEDTGNRELAIKGSRFVLKK